MEFYKCIFGANVINFDIFKTMVVINNCMEKYWYFIAHFPMRKPEGEGCVCGGGGVTQTYVSSPQCYQYLWMPVTSCPDRSMHGQLYSSTAAMSSCRGLNKALV